MTGKREPRARKTLATAKAKRPATPPALPDGAALVMLESASAIQNGSVSLPADLRRELVAAEAYFRAERRGFEPGHELEDWVAAEAAVEARFTASQAA